MPADEFRPQKVTDETISISGYQILLEKITDKKENINKGKNSSSSLSGSSLDNDLDANLQF